MKRPAGALVAPHGWTRAARVRALLRRSPAAEPRQERYQGMRLVADFEAVAIPVERSPGATDRRELGYRFVD